MLFCKLPVASGFAESVAVSRERFRRYGGGVCFELPGCLRDANVVGLGDGARRERRNGGWLNVVGALYPLPLRGGSHITVPVRTVVLVLFLLMFPVVCTGQMSSIEVVPASEVIKLLDAKHTGFIGLQFDYQVETNCVDFSVRRRVSENELTIRQRDETLAFLKSISPNYPLPWVSWIVRHEREGLTPIATFFVFNGNKRYTFLRGESDDPSIVPYNSGMIDAGYNNLHLTDNYFERILFLKLNGSSQNLEAMRKSESSKDYQYVKQVEYLGRKAWEYEREWIPGELKTVSLVIFEPQVMVVNYKTVSLKNGRTLVEFCVDEIANFESCFYPSKGHYAESESKRRYAFAVLAVKKLDEAARSKWVLDWPGGTDVRDVPNGNSFSVARTSEEVAELLKIKPEFPTVPASHVSSKVWVMLAVNVIFIIAIIVIILRKMWAKSKKA
jgi:hypothetical protein